MSTFQAVSPGFPAVVSWKTSPWALIAAADRVGQLPPHFISMFNLQKERREKRLFLLQQSVFNLVANLNQVALTDPRLLQWYLCLCPDDKNIVNEEGGFYHFLQRHPGLEVSQGHSFQKHRLERWAPPTVTSRQQLYVSQSQVTESQMFTRDQWVYMGHGNKRTKHGKAHLSCEDQSEKVSKIMEEDKGILVCLPSEDAKARKVEVSPCPATGIAGPPAAGPRIPKPDPQVTFTRPRPTSCDAMVSTQPTACSSAHTQTEVPETAEKFTSVQFYTGDTNQNLAEDFMKLKMSQDHEEKGKSWAWKTRNCDCLQRAQRAELRLLALMYSMCRQHSWRLFYTSAEGNQVNTMPQEPPANIVSILQELEFDYNEMKRQILMGVPLEQLKPLSVNSEKITAGARYIPAQVIGDLMGNISSWTFQDPPKHEEAEEKRCADDKSRNGCQVVSHGEHFHQNEMQKKQTATCGEVSGTEMWYDAEEELQPSQAADELSSDEVSNSAPPGTVTRSESLHLFEKSQSSEVTASASNIDLRVPTAIVNYLQSDEVAATELTGLQTHGCTLHEEFLSSRFKPCPVATDPQPPNTDLSSSERKLVAPPPLSSRIRTKKVVCISPTARETCVPQHFGTLGSINTLTDELLQRHPDVSRQRIVETLMELRAQHQGVLSRLPLKTIRDMTSELLTRLAVTTET